MFSKSQQIPLRNKILCSQMKGTLITSREITQRNNHCASITKLPLVKHPTIKPQKYHFATTINQYFIANKIKLNKSYLPISSFEEKLNNELKRISNRYGKTDSRQIFYPNQNLENIYNTKIDFKQYLEFKKIENRYIGFKEKARLKPLIINRKENLNKLAERFYSTGQK